MPKLTLALLCEYAFLLQNGTPGIIGIFTGIQAKEIPAVRPTTALVIEFQPEEKKKYNVEIICKSPSGKDVIEKQNHILNGDSPKKRAGLIVNLSNLTLREEGEYRIDIFVDGNKAGDLPFNFSIVK